MRRKVCVVVSARPSYSRIRTALKAIESRDDLDLQLVVAASALLERYGTVVHFMAEDGLEVAARVYMVLEGENLTTSAKTTGLGLIELATTLDNLKPDVVVTVADRYETLATAIAAAYMNVPVAHVLGGEVSGSIDERVRHAVTKMADLHFVATDKAADRVVRMGEDPSSVAVTGCPSIDLAAGILDSPELDFDPYERYGGVGPAPSLSDGYLVVLQHPVTIEYEQARAHMHETLCALRDYGLPALWFWPNVDAGADGSSGAIRAFRELERPPNIHFFKNMAPDDFLRLVYNSRCLVGNSSTGIRECSFLGVPSVDIGTRQRGRDRGANVVAVGHDRQAIAEAIDAQLANGRYATTNLYGNGGAGERIARLLADSPLRVDKRLTY
jgi:UDP-hydrolysing UDP-N-acetyl-D-glucosamine 2-epimerase